MNYRQAKKKNIKRLKEAAARYDMAFYCNRTEFNTFLKYVHNIRSHKIWKDITDELVIAAIREHAKNWRKICREKESK